MQPTLALTEDLIRRRSVTPEDKGCQDVLIERLTAAGFQCETIVFHDDLDVEFGKIKAKFGGSDAGHNGIASIDKFIGKDYSRVRIGIGKPKDKMEVSDFVLENFDEDEMLELEKIINNITDSISILIDKKLDLFSSTVNNK